MRPALARTRAAVPATALLACALLAAVLLAWAVLASSPLADPAAAQEPGSDDAAALGLEATSGYGSEAAVGRWLPVEARLSPSRPVAGELTVESASAAGTVEATREIDAAAGSTSVYRALLPAGRITVRVTEADGSEAAVEPPLQLGGRELAVGWLSDRGLPAQLPGLRVEPLGRRLDWAAVAPAWLEESPFAVEPLGSLVADTDTLAGLSDEARRNLGTALALGAHLVVVAEPGDALANLPLDGLPAIGAEPAEVTRDGAAVEVASLDATDGAWELEASDVGLGGDAILAAADDTGRGRIVVVGASPAGPLGDLAALWEEAIGPGRMGGSSTAGVEFAGNLGGVLNEVLRTGEEDVPALPGLAAFLAAYVLVVGPFNGFVLSRMGRRELAWVTVPLVTVVFTVAAFAGAVGSSDATGITATGRWWIDGRGGELVAAGAQAPTAGAHEITVEGRGWLADPHAPPPGATTINVGDPLVAEFDLEALQLGGTLAWRAIDDGAPLELEATAGDDGVDARVRNASASTVSDVIVRSGGATSHVGDMSAGESAEVTLRGGEPAMHAAPIHTAHTLPQSLERALASGVPLLDSGTVWAVGTDEAAGPRVTIDGSPAAGRGRLLAVGVTARSESRAPAPQAVQRETLRLDRAGEAPRGHETQQALVRFRLPGGSAPEALHASPGEPGMGAEPGASLMVWDRVDRRWADVDGPLDVDRVVSPLGHVQIRPGEGVYDLRGLSLSGSAPEGGTP